MLLLRTLLHITICEKLKFKQEHIQHPLSGLEALCQGRHNYGVLSAWKGFSLAVVPTVSLLTAPVAGFQRGFWL